MEWVQYKVLGLSFISHTPSRQTLGSLDRVKISTVDGNKRVRLLHKYLVSVTQLKLIKKGRLLKISRSSTRHLILRKFYLRLLQFKIMINQFFILSPRGDTIINKDFRGDATPSLQETFFRKVRFTEKWLTHRYCFYRKWSLLLVTS